MGCTGPKGAPFLPHFLRSQSSARSLGPGLGSPANKAMENLDKVRWKAPEKVKASEIEFLKEGRPNLDCFLCRRKSFKYLKGYSTGGCG